MTIGTKKINADDKENSALTNKKNDTHVPELIQSHFILIKEVEPDWCLFLYDYHLIMTQMGEFVVNEETPEVGKCQRRRNQDVLEVHRAVANLVPTANGDEDVVRALLGICSAQSGRRTRTHA